MLKTSNDGTRTMLLRRFGINEAYQLAMYLLDQYRSTTLACRYTIPPALVPAEAQTQLEEAFKVAVVDTIMRHPMLQVGVKNANSKTPSWVQLRSLDLTQHVIWLYIQEHDDFEKTVQNTLRVQLDDRFPDLAIEQPGWKVTIIRQGYAPLVEVLLTWNHHHFDAMGAKVLHEDFLEMLNTVENRAYKRPGLDGNVLRLPYSPPMLPIPIEGLKSLPVDLMYLIKAFWEEIRPPFLNRDASQAVWCPIRSTPYKTQYRDISVDRASLLTILALCRRNKTTITGLLNGLLLIAFSLHLDSTAARAFQSSTIVDHRRNLPASPPDVPWVRSDRAVSNYVTQLPHRYDRELVARIRSKLPSTDAGDWEGEKIALSTNLQRELWAVAAQNRQEIVRKLEAGLRNDLVGLFKWVTDWQKTMSNVAKRPRQFSWLVTNIGVLDGKPSTDGDGDGQKWSINRAQFGLSAEIPASAIEVAPVSVVGGGMCIGVIWPDCAVDVTFGERIVADLERWLAQLASQS